MTSSLRALGVATVLAAALPLLPATASAAPAASADVRTAAPAASAERALPSTPVITRTRGGQYARVDFRVRDDGGSRWTRIQARGVRWSGGVPSGECHPGPIRSQGTWVGFHPGSRGLWSFEIRVKNRTGWSAWSEPGKRVRVR